MGRKVGALDAEGVYHSQPIEGFFLQSGSTFNKQEMIDVVEICIGQQPSRADPMTHICSNCNALVALIIDFRTACQQANDLLKSETYRTVRSSTWERSNVEETFRQAANLVQEHRYEVKALLKSNKCHVGEATENFLEDVKCGPEIPHVLEQDDESPSSPEESSIAARLTCGKRGREKIMCPICGEMVSLETLEGHQNRHAGVQPFTCDIPGCGAKLYSQLALRQHRSRHKSASKFYDCGVCGKRIKSAAYWLIHRKSHTEEPRFSCDICGKKFHRKTLRSSTWERSNAEETFQTAANLVQEHCYEVKALLKSNESQVDRETEDLLMDVKCEPEMLQELGEDEEPTEEAQPSRKKDGSVCPICGELVSKKAFEGHQNRHAGVQPFTCDIPGCGAKLYSKHALQQHRSRHNSMSKTFDCEVCGKRIKGAAYWLIHRKSHTEEPRFSCDVCGKKFHRKLMQVETAFRGALR
ncbi:gastrula zinc finger protein XLCGF7.1 [Culex quinquefasciatus]|uniref:Gastrula zinc finger protein XLCGF7.1 n=1 Tax=Culex quinquefasciatus TaxID=7176 RepID=B0X181_CULQU|nr:gastrula zinc finger protein XLCGF7.1 [Culex quinquefasciatus]|eukprot:XP_001863403.1 gastrula zinc finger protein XLCGF7.1 [Culex quinquefasciatus]